MNDSWMDDKLKEALIVICNHLELEWSSYNEWNDEGEYCMSTMQRVYYLNKEPKKNLTKYLESLLDNQYSSS